jgi:hypothetical protein
MNLIKETEYIKDTEYLNQHEYYSSLHSEKFKNLVKDTNKYYDIYFYGINYYSDKLDNEVHGSENYYQIKKKMDNLYNKYYALQKSNKILKYEADILWEISKYYLDKWNKVMKKKKKDTSLKKTITKTKRKQIESEVCSICLDTHSYKNVIQLNCSHVFGKVCFQKLLVVQKRKHFVMKCPLCRTEPTKYSLFKMK